MELHTSIERIMLDQNKGYAELSSSAANARTNGAMGRNMNNGTPHVVSMRSRWVGKSGRIRREGMGKRVNFCARSVVTCDSYIDADEIMVPHSIASRLTSPVVVYAFNIADLEARMRMGQVLFLQRASPEGRMRSITHVAVQKYTQEPGDCLIRRGTKYADLKAPLPVPEDVPLPIQCAHSSPILCFGDRIRRKKNGALLDPLRTIMWPTLYVGDTVLVTPKDGDWCMMNRQPTLVQESMLGMRMRIGPNFSFALTCGPIEALRGDYDGDEINLHLPQGSHVVSELQHLMCVSEQVVTGQSGSPVVRLIQDAVVVTFWLTHLQPETHCPMQLSRSVFEQIAVDIDLPSVFFRLQQIRYTWQYEIAPDHPMKQAMAHSNVDYMNTGYAVMSLCLPQSCQFTGRIPATERLVSIYRRSRHLPPRSVPIDVQRGIFVGGVITADTLTGSKGLLNHIYQHHGPQEGIRFLSRVQRLVTCVSLYGYCPSVGLDDCLLSADVRATARHVIHDKVNRYKEEIATRITKSLPYYLNEETSADAEVAQLVQLRGESETFITRQVLRPKRSKHAVVKSAASATRMNQIALLAMLGTKGSVPRGLLVTTADLVNRAT